MREDWPHLDILADKHALLGTDSRLKLMEAVLFDIRRRVDELNDSIASAGGRLNLVEETLTQQRQTGPNFSQPIAQGLNTFPSPPADGIDAFHEDVAHLRHSVEKECMKREQEIISVQRQLDGFRDSYKRLGEAQRIQQSSLDSCHQRFKNYEDMRASIQMLIDAESEMRERLEEVQHNVQNCLAMQQTLNKEQTALADASARKEPKLAASVNPVFAGHVAKLSREMSGVTERLTSLELCMQGSTFERQESSVSDNSVVKDVRRMQLAIATVSRSVSKVAKDLYDMRASELASRSSTATSLSSTLTQGSVSGQRPDIPRHHASSARGTDRFARKSLPVQMAPRAHPLCIRNAGIRSLDPNSNRAPAKEDVASDASTSMRSLSPPHSTNTDSLSTSPRSKFASAQALLSAVPKDSRSATLGAKNTARSAMTADRFSLRPQVSMRPSETLSRLAQGDKPGPVC
mmetsp:Transcript_14266/g.27666  ORF Transcript_14266/g.27666 Transcript_14266/m.27666 type:complete len:461 (-) Transcript_14266:314-1696(-)